MPDGIKQRVAVLRDVELRQMYIMCGVRVSIDEKVVKKLLGGRSPFLGSRALVESSIVAVLFHFNLTYCGDAQLIEMT